MLLKQISLRIKIVFGLQVVCGLAISQTLPPQIHMVYMGGNDCPPCVFWRATELPKLEKNEVFNTIKFSYVQKSVRSPVPGLMFLPDDVKPYKSKLDEASAQRAGSAQVAILVNGEVYDYYFGTRSAEEIEKMLMAINQGTEYPFKRCLRRDSNKKCELPA